jgi:hypothetical protein
MEIKSNLRAFSLIWNNFDNIFKISIFWNSINFLAPNINSNKSYKNSLIKIFIIFFFPYNIFKSKKQMLKLYFY